MTRDRPSHQIGPPACLPRSSQIEAIESLLANLIDHPTVAGGSNVELVQFIADILGRAGAQVEVIAATRKNARNLHAVVGPTDRGGVLLSGHTDVVSTDGQEWSHEPFSLTSIGSRLYGRGTADMKGFIAVAVRALVEASHRELVAPLHLALSADEELGCRGVGPLLDHLSAAAVRPELVVVGEPTEMKIATEHKGKLAYAVTVRGLASHSSLTPDGVNAVEYGAHLINTITTVGRQLADAEKDPAFSIPYATTSTGPIKGGTVLNIVPDLCRFEFELRYLPGQDPQSILAPVERQEVQLTQRMQARSSTCSIRTERLVDYPPLAADHDATPLIMELIAAYGRSDGLDFGSEAGLYKKRLGARTIVCGPGSMRQAHRADEYVERRQLEVAWTMLDRLLDRLGRRGAT